MEFPQKYEALYGKHAVTPNIHLHRHIERCIIDYVHFWLFAFVGCLETIMQTKKSMEIQLMCQFLDDNLIYTFAESDSFLAKQAFDLPKILMHTGSSFCGSADATISITFLNAEDIASVLLLSSIPVQPSNDFLLQGLPIYACPPFRRKRFHTDAMRYLHQSYSTFIPNYDNQQASLPSMFEEFHSLDFWGERINSRKRSYSCISLPIGRRMEAKFIAKVQIIVELA